jgi:hypothetical protein
MSWNNTAAEPVRGSEPTSADQAARAPYEPPRVLKKRAVTQVTFSGLNGTGGGGGFHINP